MNNVVKNDATFGNIFYWIMFIVSLSHSLTLFIVVDHVVCESSYKKYMYIYISVKKESIYGLLQRWK